MVDPRDEAVSAWREECEKDAAWDGGLSGGYRKGTGSYVQDPDPFVVSTCVHNCL
jgi:hypothetical protein